MIPEWNETLEREFREDFERLYGAAIVAPSERQLWLAGRMRAEAAVKEERERVLRLMDEWANQLAVPMYVLRRRLEGVTKP